MRARGSSIASLLFLLVASVLASCGGGGGGRRPQTIGDDNAARTGAPEGWPSVLVVTHGAGPALFLGPEDGAAGLGYVSIGTRARLDGPPVNGRVPVTLGGGLQARGWMPLDRLGAYLTQRGRIDGTPTYVGVGDLVSFVRRNDDGSFQVHVQPWLGRAENDRLGPWTGTVPASWLSDSPSEGPDAGLNAGENKILPAGRDVPVYDRPNGNVIATLPAADPPHRVTVLRTRDGWSGIRAGVGPYVVGFVQGELAAADGPPRATYAAPARRQGAPQRISEEQGPLFRVARGTRVRFLDRPIARLRTDGWARELGRTADGVDVYVAVDDGAAVRGLVATRSLQPAPESESATPAQPEAAAPTGTISRAAFFADLSSAVPTAFCGSAEHPRRACFAANAEECTSTFRAALDACSTSLGSQIPEAIPSDEATSRQYGSVIGSCAAQQYETQMDARGRRVQGAAGCSR